MANSTRRKSPAKPDKPQPDFPLFPHATGYWCKKVRGSLHYFTRWEDDPKGVAALKKWDEEKEDLLAGRTPRGNRDGLTMKELVNRFLGVKETMRDAGELSPRTYDDYYRTCERLLKAFGSKRLVDDLAADDFEKLRASLAKQYGLHRLGGEVQRTKVLFNYGIDAGLIEKQIRYGSTFKKPRPAIMRAARLEAGEKFFDAKQLRTLIDAAEQPLKAMILLGVNCAFGNHDCGTLPLSALDLKSGWVAFPRPKTAIPRRCPLWRETVAAIKAAIKQRPKPKDKTDAGLVFITRFGGRWSKDTADSPVTKEFRKLLDAKKLHRRGLGFYTLRHVFQTIADEAKDPVATRFIMGHSDSSMSGVYRERISDERLQAVVDHVHSWLFPEMK